VFFNTSQCINAQLVAFSGLQIKPKSDELLFAHSTQHAQQSFRYTAVCSSYANVWHTARSHFLCATARTA